MGRGRWRWNRLKELFPPGYPYEKERGMAAVLLAGGVIGSLGFFQRLHGVWEGLYYLDRSAGEKLLCPGEKVASFLQLSVGYMGWFLPFYLFLAVMVVVHYRYYCRDTRSIYLMRRLPGGGVFHRSCVQAPLLGMGVGVVVQGMLSWLYYGIYRMVIPGECMPCFW